jgi:hypothetical protein
MSIGRFSLDPAAHGARNSDSTGRFRKGTKGNVRHIHQETPFGIGFLFSDDIDGL